MQHVFSRVTDRPTRAGRSRAVMPLVGGGAATITAPTPPLTQAPTSTPATPTTPTPPPGLSPDDPGTAPAAPDAAPSAGRDGARIEVPSDDMRHLLCRFSYGVSEELVQQAQGLAAPNGLGDAGSAWFEQQLDPTSIADPFANRLKSWWPHLSWPPEKQWYEESHGGPQGWQLQDDFLRWTLLRRIYSNRQVLEIMSEFWSNLLHVPAPLAKVFPQRVAYDETIRRHALGRYDDLLVAAVLHPAMLCYLDNDKSTAIAPNENLGRELLELHTVGHEAGIHESDVIGSTRILTGWRVDTTDTWAGYYSEDDHYVGRVRVFGFDSPNDSRDGRDLTVRYLRWLARRPETAERVATRLATRFISDTPSDDVINDLALVFRQSGTDIRATLRALVAHPEFKAARGLKVRTPNDDLANTYRVMGIDIEEPHRVTDAATRILIAAKHMGQAPFGWPSPNGFPDESQAWSSAARVLGSWGVHRQLAFGRMPRTGIEFRTAAQWLPDLPCRFDALIDHLARRMLAMPASTNLINAASVATGVAVHEQVTHSSRVVGRQFGELLSTLLDTPEHMTR